QEYYRFAVGADPGFAVAQNACALRFQTITGSDNIGYFVAEMMHTACGVLFEERGYGRAFAQRFEQFNLGIANIDEDNGYAMLGQYLRLGQSRTQLVAIKCGCGLNIRHRDRYMVELSEHYISPDFALSYVP